MNLWSDFLTNDTRLIHKWKHYFPIDERHFQQWVYKPLTFVEIGCGLGGSLQMWKRYFGPHATIVGIDILPQCKDYEEDQIEVRIGSQQDADFLKSILDEFGTPDIVLDDGSHMMSHMVASFNFLYPRVAKNGVYMVEDLHTAYWDEYEGGLRKSSTFIEICKNLIDELNADHTRDALPPTDFTRTTLSMHIYDSVAVFEKGSHTKKWAPEIGQRDYPSSEGKKDGAEQPRDCRLAETKEDAVGTLTAQLEQAVSARDEAQAALKKTRDSLASVEEALSRIRRSISWRLTEPARRIMNTLRSGPRDARPPQGKNA